MTDFFIKEEEMDNFQTQLIQRNINRSMVVSGCAGSGKSIIALWKAKQINDLGRTFYFVVYTKVLKKYFDDGIRQINDPALEGMRNMLNDERKFFYYDKWKGGTIINVEFMIIDEAQDFDKEDIIKLKTASQTAVYFFGDSAQSIYKFKKQTISMGDIAHLVGFDAPELLMHNYRLPKKVARVAEIIGNLSDLEWRCVKEGENLPELISCSNTLDKIAEIITNLHLTNVGILFPNNFEVQNAYNYLRNKLSIEAKFEFDNGGRFKSTHLDLDFASDNPKLMTYHSSKGLQFEAVFIPQPKLFEKNESPRAPLYVAMTRTSDRLYFLYSGNKPDFFDEIPNNLFNNNDNNIIQL